MGGLGWRGEGSGRGYEVRPWMRDVASTRVEARLLAVHWSLARRGEPAVGGGEVPFLVGVERKTVDKAARRLADAGILVADAGGLLGRRVDEGALRALVGGDGLSGSGDGYVVLPWMPAALGRRARSIQLDLLAVVSTLGGAGGRRGFETTSDGLAGLVGCSPTALRQTLRGLVSMGLVRAEVVASARWGHQRVVSLALDERACAERVELMGALPAA